MLVELLPRESSAPALSPYRAGAHIIDALVVFKRAHNFKLASAHRLFCGASAAHVAPPTMRVPTYVLSTSRPLLPTFIAGLRDLCLDLRRQGPAECAHRASRRHRHAQGKSPSHLCALLLLCPRSNSCCPVHGHLECCQPHL